MNWYVFLSLLLAHIVGDFYLQSDRLCTKKRSAKIGSWFLYVHSLTLGVISWAIVFDKCFAIYAVAIALSHLVIDLIKVYCPKGLWYFVADQLLHILVLVAISYMYESASTLPLEFVGASATLWIIAILLCLRPANISIKLVMENYSVGASESCKGIKNAGALIGALERLLTIVFMAKGQYEAIGFLVAAKSILRFKDTDTAKTEYVLAGTFLSFAIAILCGLILS